MPPDDTLDFAPKFDANGLIAAVAQDYKTGEILMLAYMNEEALRLTAETGEAVYWSRSRARLWKKGETSGNTQKIHEILVDCDEDALVLKIEQVGECRLSYRTAQLFLPDPSLEGKRVTLREVNPC